MMRKRRQAAWWGPAVLASVLTASTLGQGGPPAAVTVDDVRLESVQERRLFTGELRAVRRSKVATQEPGLVIELPVVEGLRVSAGDVLARLDPRRLDVEVRRIEADEQAVANIVEERKATLDWRSRDLELYQASYERGAANPKELFDAQSEVRIARARVLQGERQRDVIRARAELLQERLGDMTIRAPFDGVVVIKHTELGEWVGEGDPVVELVSVGDVEAWLDVPQRYYDHVAGAPVEVDISVGRQKRPGLRARARVIPLMDPRARSFALVATLADKDGKLTPGMSIKAWVPTGEVAEHLTVSRDAVLRNDAGAFVYVVREGAEGVHNAVPVSVLEMFPWAARVVVRSEVLEAGDMVIIEGNERLFPMMPVTPMKPGSSNRPPGGGPS